MPKEITHFALAWNLGRSLPGSSLFLGPVKKFSNLFLLGAIVPDIPFYYLIGPAREAVQDLSLPFQQTRARALSPVLEFLERDQFPPALALAAGVIRQTFESGHRVLDIVGQALVVGRVKTALDHPGLPLIRPALSVDGFEVWYEKQDIRPLVYQGVSPPF